MQVPSVPFDAESLWEEDLKLVHFDLTYKVMKRILCLLAFCLVIKSSLFAEDKTIVLGGEKGWPSFSSLERITKGKGKYGYDCIELDTNHRVADENTDLLLSFEDKICDDTNNYSVVENKMLRTTMSIMGKQAGLSRGTGGIRLAGKSGTLFGTRGNTGSFTIEFWLRPSIAENGEIVFSWRSSRTVASYPLYQMISASFLKNHLEWKFTNVFDGYTDNGGEITLTSYRTIIPDVWTHHQISFNDETGLLEYRIDSRLEALTYVTSNKRERGGSIYYPQLGVVADILICPEYTGSIDDFRIIRCVNDDSNVELNYDTYSKKGGRFVSEPFLVVHGSVLKSLEALADIPPETAVNYFVRSGDNFYNWTQDYPAWVAVENGEEIENVQGMYFQVACDLYPDGGGSNTPKITQIKLNYTEVSLPLPPFKVYAKAGNSQVKLNWSYSVDDTSGGYYVYYGERPGEYLGREAVEGQSPIKAGNTSSITLNGLENGKIYYFAVSSYSKFDSTITGPLSKEVSARPLRSQKDSQQ